LEITESFHSSTAVNENEDCEEAVVGRILSKHQKTSEDREIGKDDTTEHQRLRVQVLVPIC
jgi:hypothetical protein